MSGVVLGPPNYHDYQNQLRKLHAERFSRMPFEVYKSRVRIVRDEEVVKKWVDDQSWKTDYICLNLPESVRLGSMEAVEKHFREMTFTFPDGSLGVVDYLANGDRSFPKERVEMFFGGKVAVLDDFVSLQLIEEGRRREHKAALDKGWKDEIAAFTRSIRAGGAPPIPYEQLIGVTKATFAAVESIREQRSIAIN